MEEESQEVRWDSCKWDEMVKEVFNMIATSLPPDLTLVTEDGKRLEVHSLILKASSPIFRSILDKTNIGNFTAANTMIYMPGFVHEHLVSVVEFMYLGKTKVDSPLLEAFMTTFNSLGMPSNKLGKNTVPVTPSTSEEGRKDPMVGKTNDVTKRNEIYETEDGEIIEGNFMGSTSGEMENEKSVGNNFIDNQFERFSHPTPANCKTAEIPSDVDPENLGTFTQIIRRKDNQIGTNFECTKENEVEKNGVNLKSVSDFDPEIGSVDPDFVTPKQEGPELQDEDNGSVGNDGEIEAAMIKLRALSHESEESINLVNSESFSNTTHDKTPIAKKKGKRQKEKKEKTINSKKAKQGMDGRGESRGKIRNVTCEICGKHYRLMPFRKNNKYFQHMKRHKIRDHDCGCGIKFDSFNQKHRHMRVVHQGYFNCSLCPQNSNSSFATEQFFKEHKRSKHPEKEELPKLPYKETFTCKISKCKRTFIKKASMMYHANSSHDEEGPLVCDHCGKKMRSKIALSAHEKKVHNPEPCPICSKVVKKLRGHILTSHTDNSTLKVRCENCGKGFKDNGTLKSHEMNVHIKTRPFRCRYSCQNDIGYNDLSNRNSHEKKKHGGLFTQQVSES